MIEKIFINTHHSRETLKRSVVKTIAYRTFILSLDFATVYLFTGQIKAAAGFTVVSNLYTTLVYFFNERIWDKIKWGKIIYNKRDKN
jgi:adenylylsulfate kinase